MVRLSDGTRDSDKDTALSSLNQHPLSIWSDGTHVWVLDTDDRYVYAYELGSGGVPLLDRSYFLSSDITNPKGMWADGQVRYFAEAGTPTLRAYSMTEGLRQTRWDIALDPNNTDAGGIWSNGETIWVLDTSDAHIYAYKPQLPGPRFRSCDGVPGATPRVPAVPA